VTAGIEDCAEIRLADAVQAVRRGQLLLRGRIGSEALGPSVNR